MEGEYKSEEKQARAETFGEVDVKEETEATEGIGDDLFTNLETSQSSHMVMVDKSSGVDVAM
jgi:hypothetical protein